MLLCSILWGHLWTFILPKILLRSPEKFTLAVGLFNFINDKYANNFTVFAAGAIMIAVPIAIVFLFLQRYLVSGLTTGATKVSLKLGADRNDKEPLMNLLCSGSWEWDRNDIFAKFISSSHPNYIVCRNWESISLCFPANLHIIVS